MVNSDKTTNLFWIDLEWTNWDPVNIGKIVEISSLVTNTNLEILEEGPNLVIHQPDEVLETMGDWQKTNFPLSGLLEQIKQSTISPEQAEKSTLNFVQKWCDPQQSPLCGNSVHMDRKFLHFQMPNLLNYFHYRIIDVSTIKELYKRWYPHLPEYEKQKKHRALDDIKESVAELKYYRDKIFLPNNST